MSSTAEVAGPASGEWAKWLATATVLCGMLASILSSTMVNVAIPDIMGAFGIGQDQAHWLSTGFLAAMTASMPMVAWLRQTFGARALFFVSMAVFSLAALVGESAETIELVIASRVVQGFCAGLSQPLAMLTIFQLFPPDNRGQAMGIFGMGVILAPALGPTFGGLIVDNFGWRYVFLGSLPMCVLGMLMSLVFLPGRDPDAARTRFDWLGLALVATSVVCLLNALSNGPRWGWDSNAIVILVTISILGTVALLVWESTVSNPMINLALYRNLRFAAASMVAFIFGAGMFGSMYLIPLFAQTVQQLTPTDSGLMLMPAGMILIFVFPIAGRMADRVPPHGPIIAGLVAFAIAGWLLAQTDVNTSFATMVWLVIAGRVGLGFVIPSMNSSALRALPPHLLSQGSGAINFVRMLGAAFGVNGLAFIIESRAQHHAEMLTATQTAGNPTTMVYLRQLEAMLAESGLAAAERSAMALDFLGRAIFAQANTFAFHDAYLVVSLIFLMAVVPAWVLGRGFVPPRAGGRR